tara:strand:- start:30118 stop:31926 length:1809 start_codon:yes stop_codon:yes gene_type:complete
MNFFLREILLFLILLISIEANSFSFNNSFYEVEPSIIVPQKNDTIILNEYKKIRNLYKKNDFGTSLGLALKFLEKLEKENKYVGLEYRTNFLIANIFQKNKNHIKAIYYYKSALKNLDITNNLLIDTRGYFTEDKSSYFKARSISYLRLGNEYLALSKNDSAEYFYKKAINIKSLNDAVLSYKGSAMSNLSGIFMKDSLYDLAGEYASNAVEIHRKRNKKVSEAAALSNLANIYLKENNFEQAKETYFEALDLIKRDKSNRSLEIKERLYFNLAYNLYKLKDYTAYNYQELSYEIKDSIRDKEIRKIIAEINGKYNLDVGKALGRQEEENKRIQAERTTWLIGLSSFSVIILLAFFLNQYKLRQKNLSLRLSQQELLQQQKLEKIRSESQIRILNATIDGKETERKQIAETLHDSVSALLSSANLHLQACKKIFKGVIPIEVDKSQSIINEASQKIRDLSHTLVSSILLKFGLAYAVKDMAEKYSNSQLEILYETKDIQRYDQDFEIKLYNIIQELINNTLKHSEASIAKIFLEEKNDKLFITIQDDGKGFDKLQVSEKDGLGINQIDARIHMMQGKFTIKTEKNNGTLINIELPGIKKKII